MILPRDKPGVIVCCLTLAVHVYNCHKSEASQRMQQETRTSVGDEPYQNYEEMFSEDVPDRPKYKLHFSECSNETWINIVGTRGEVDGLKERHQLYASMVCQWSIALPNDLSLEAFADLNLAAVVDVFQPCEYGSVIVIYDQTPVDHKVKRLDQTGCGALSAIVVSTTGHLYFRLNTAFDSVDGAPGFKIRFQSTERSLRERLSVLYTGPVSGVITTPGFSLERCRPSNMQASLTLTVPQSQYVTVSFSNFEHGIRSSSECKADRLEFFVIDAMGTNTSLFRKCVAGRIPTQIYNSSLTVEYTTNVLFQVTGFRMLFSMHRASDLPHRLASGLFNCSVPHYASFKQHVHCNLEPECQGGEDEGEHCSFSPPGCQGAVGYKNKCYFLAETPVSYRLQSGRDVCRERGGNFATMKTHGEWEAILTLFHLKQGLDQCIIAIGLRTFSPDMPDIYLRSYVWTDNTVSYGTNITEHAYLSFGADSEMYSFMIVIGRPKIVSYLAYRSMDTSFFMCERQSKDRQALTPDAIVISNSNGSTVLMNSTQTLVQCPKRHLTHDFLSCDVASSCASNRHVPMCKPPTMPRGVSMFVCEDGRGSVHYTLVCDFRPDCQDGSDEAFCQHGQLCEGFTCSNGQCVDRDRRCDLVRNCVDGTDEANCDYAQLSQARLLQRYSLPPPAIINFHYGGLLTYTPMETCAHCPDTHFRCPGESNYCLPVYVRCNGVYDCAGHEDEADCENYSCPGYYRCRGFSSSLKRDNPSLITDGVVIPGYARTVSTVCVHADHLCDGMPQCPQHDDEWFCDGHDCPEGCQCQGLAFICPHPFPASNFPKLRYLDADGSLMTPRNVSTNYYIVWLSLQFCNITSLSELSFPNLRTLYIGYNKLTTISMETFNAMYSLHLVSLEGNPLVSFEARTPTGIEVLQLSHTQLHLFDGGDWAGFQRLRVLNVSFTMIHTVSQAGFRYLPKLVELDISGNPVKDYPSDLFKGNHILRRIYAGNYKLCCKVLLPDNFDENLCFAPEDEVSSCSDLLRTDVYRLLLWAMSVLSVVGNTGCVASRLFTRSASRSGYPVFVSSLSLADLLMGLFLVVIGSADAVYRGTYTWYEREWTQGRVCQMAGFMALLSSEVSAFMIFLVTLDRFLALRFPFSTLRFQQQSARLTCIVLWALGAMLAGLPLLPMTSHWQFYSQSGICIPLPITRQDFGGRDYAFSLMIVLNFVLFLLIAAGQVTIYWSIRVNAMTYDNTKKSQDLKIARRLITVAVTDFLCWFPIGLLGVMASLGVPVPGEVKVAIAILVMPLNSALNPFLYTFNVVAEKRRKANERELTKLLESMMATDQDTGEAEQRSIHM